MTAATVVYTEARIAAFWKKVDRNGPIPAHCPELGPCWIWTAAFRGPYGHFWNGTNSRGAHRFSWQITHGEIPLGMRVMHRCDNPPCCNPLHLSLGTDTDNARDREAKGRGRQPRGSQTHGSRLSEAQVANIIERFRQGGISQYELARQYGVTHSTVWGIVHGRRWAHVQVEK